jgi:hypothetical protein
MFPNHNAKCTTQKIVTKKRTFHLYSGSESKYILYAVNDLRGSDWQLSFCTTFVWSMHLTYMNKVSEKFNSFSDYGKT